MKIGLVCSYHLDIPGGVQKQVREWGRQLEACGHEGVILTCGPKAGLEGENIVYLGSHLPFRTNGDITVLSAYLKSRNSLKDYLESEQFDILHFHEPFSPFLPWQLLRVSETVNVCTFHTYPKKSVIVKLLEKPIKSILLSPLVKKIKKFSAVSQHASFIWRDMMADEIEIIPNGIDLTKYRAQNKIEQYSDGKINILYVGRLTKRKGIFHLIKALHKLSRQYDNLRLIIVGSGPLERRIQRSIKKHKLNNVELEGLVSNEKLPPYFATADIFCAPAIHGESFGIVLLEAMANRLPIVAFANAGYKEILKDKPFCDFLAKPEDVTGLSRQLEKFICSRQLREEMGKSGFNEVHRYSWERITPKIIRFYEKALDSKKYPL